MYRPTEADRLSALEYRGAPHGPHGPGLQLILDYFRTLPLEGKHVLVCSVPHVEWTLACLTGDRADPIKILDDVRYASVADAEWDIFKRRWKSVVGTDLD